MHLSLKTFLWCVWSKNGFTEFFVVKIGVLSCTKISTLGHFNDTETGQVVWDHYSVCILNNILNTLYVFIKL